MSAGSFVTSKYETNRGEILPIKIQPETASANIGSANTAPSGTITVNLFAKSQKNRRSYGVGARGVRLKFTGTVPTGYSSDSIVSIPVLTPTVWNAITTETTGTYLGAAVIAVGTYEETRK